MPRSDNANSDSYTMEFPASAASEYQQMDLPKPDMQSMTVATADRVDGGISVPVAMEGEQSEALETDVFLTSNSIEEELRALCSTSDMKGMAEQCGILEELQADGSFSVAPSALLNGNVVPVQVVGNGTSQPEASTETAKRTIPERSSVKKSASEDKKQKGLRHFSLMVLEKVEEKGQTTFPIVAEELLESVRAMSTEDGKKPLTDQNIKRRVYDALNVMHAMKIIEKRKKEITWVGMPNHSNSRITELQIEREQARVRLREKEEVLRDAKRKLALRKTLLQRNIKDDSLPIEKRLALPCILICTPKDTPISCQIAEDRTAFYFKFKNPFQMYDETKIINMISEEYHLS